MNRLTNANSTDQTFNAVYAYDGDGHMTSSSMNNVIASTPRMLNNHRISNYGGNAIEYDNKGNVTYEGLTGWRTNEFNKSNLPLNMTNGTMSYTFRYNEKGERTNKNFSNGTEAKNEYYLNDYLGRTLAVYEDGRIKEGIINGNDVIGEIEVGVEKDKRYYYLKDHLGSIRVVLESPSSTIVSATDFGPYGETLRQMNDSIDVRYDYTGKEKDKESGDRYFGARYLGVLPFWKSVDPLAEKYPGVSPYSYALGNPMRFVDPKGSYLAETADGSDPEGKEKRKNDEQNNSTRQLNYIAPQGLTPELTLSFIIKMKLIRAEIIAKEVLAETQSKASELPGGTKGLHNGPADAWRHARWNERMVKEIDPITAFVAGVGHEFENLFNGGPLDEIFMDLHNNAVGRSGESPDKLLKEGKLRIIQKSFKNKGERYYP